MATGLPQLQRQVINGVTVLSAESPAGRSGAMLMFRVGRFDETLPTSGITHLVEHLTFTGSKRLAYQYNAEVNGRFTTFIMESAKSSDVADFVTAICRGLAADHADRLDQEKLVLRTEAASRGGPGPYGGCLLERFGATGPGVAGYEEYGLRSLSWAQVADWRDRWFVAANAVLCVLGEVPPELTIDLPAGRQPQLSAPIACVTQLPGFTVASRSGIGMSMVATDQTSDYVALDVLQHRLTDDLRHDKGLSYHVQVAAEPIDASHRHAWLAADALPEQTAMAAHIMLGTFEKLNTDGCAADEIAEYARRLQDAFQSPGGPMLVMHREARRILLGQPLREPADTLRRVHKLTPDDVATAATALYGSVIMATPQLIPAVQGRMPQLPQWSTTEIEGGDRYPSKDSAAVLTINASGVMLTTEPGRFASVPADQIAALVRWNDGKLRLVGTDGFSIHIDPAEWDGAADALQRLQAGTSPELIIAVDAPGPSIRRPAAPVSTPATTSSPAASVPKSRKRRLARSTYWALVVVFVIVIGVAVLTKAFNPVFGGVLVAAVIGPSAVRQAQGQRRKRSR